jgi:Ni/Co efflux regulator RcnB
MKKFLITTVALAVMASAGVASAAPRDVRDAKQDVREARQDLRQAKQENRYERRAAKRYKAGRYNPPRGYHARRWARGQQLPSSYRSRAYVVDYHRYGLRAPPRGYHYVRVGNDVVLTAIASGIIASVIVDLFN